MKGKIIKNSLLIIVTFVLGLIAHINISSSNIKLTIQQKKAESSDCHELLRYCDGPGGELNWACIDEQGLKECDSASCILSSNCSS